MLQCPKLRLISFVWGLETWGKGKKSKATTASKRLPSCFIPRQTTQNAGKSSVYDGRHG